MAPPSRRLPPLMDELVEEILLRFPPDDPASLLRAALVCKRWCRLVSGPFFRRRFRELHRTSPMLGFLCFVPSRATISCFRHRGSGDTRFISTTSFRLSHAVVPSWRAVDALHGRILFYDMDTSPETVELDLIVWNPITGEARRLPMVPLYTYRWSAALLCAAPGCDHVDCGYGPFRVVVVATEPFDGLTSACVYSSEQHAWSVPISVQNLSVRILRGPSVLVANALYFKCDQNRILEYDMGKQELSVISLPSVCDGSCKALMTAEDGGLGFAVVQRSKLSTWSRVDDGSNVGWAQRRVIELDKLLPLSTIVTRVVAVVDVLGLIFIATYTGLFLFTIDLKSGLVRQIYEDTERRDTRDIVPYTSFCTPALGAASTDEGPRAGASSASKA
ncbi:uncharacterized protein LOC133891168 [Phragmites australis]|uniref:uncharacterized protein LOC133891168 n=1 Tax=Phragmites australis TaxID=29695 RepID=UPI002D77BD2A|nr:uncharacterized protein LOC133891168 [Phragmites australis]